MSLTLLHSAIQERVDPLGRTRPVGTGGQKYPQQHPWILLPKSFTETPPGGVHPKTEIGLGTSNPIENSYFAFITILCVATVLTYTLWVGVCFQYKPNQISTLSKYLIYSVKSDFGVVFSAHHPLSIPEVPTGSLCFSPYIPAYSLL